jgi:hydroxymethylbilane synthase
MADSSTTLKLGTRASALARWQAEWVAAQLTAAGVAVELVLISTRGDQQQTGPIGQIVSAGGAIGGQGVFTKELQNALLDGRIDLAVHSLKDLPTDPVAGLALAAVPDRGPVGDVLLSRRGAAFAELPQGAVIGTGSLRRRAQLLHARPDLKMADLRGNVDTRLKKLEAGDYGAIVLAEAGVTRLGLTGHITERLSLAVMTPAVGQGALGIEMRADDPRRNVLARLDSPATHAAVTAERSMLATLRGGCLAPVAAWGRVDAEDALHLTGVVLSVDGRKRLETTYTAEAAEADELGQRVAEALIADGASQLIAAARA